MVTKSILDKPRSILSASVFQTFRKEICTSSTNKNTIRTHHLQLEIFKMTNGFCVFVWWWKFFFIKWKTVNCIAEVVKIETVLTWGELHSDVGRVVIAAEEDNLRRVRSGIHDQDTLVNICKLLRYVHNNRDWSFHELIIECLIYIEKYCSSE